MKSSKPSPPTQPKKPTLLSDESDEGGALFGSSPPQGKPREEEEEEEEEKPKPKKRLAGAVPMFGGSDLLNAINKRKVATEEPPEDLFGDEGETKPPPPAVKEKEKVFQIIN